MQNDYLIGAFRGRKLIQRRGEIGGAKSVFVKLQGIKNELVYPTFGGEIKNPFKGAAKMFAGDLCEYRTNDKGVNPEIYLLKTYEVAKVDTDATIVYIVRDKFKHIPFVGDNLGVAPAEIGGSVTTNATIVAVAATTDSGKDVWKLTFSKALTGAAAGNILVEVGADNKMVVKAVNAVIDADCDMFDSPATGDEDFDGARYFYTPALGGIMYTHKMSPVPDCVKKKNISPINGWFQIQSV